MGSHLKVAQNNAAGRALFHAASRFDVIVVHLYRRKTTGSMGRSFSCAIKHNGRNFDATSPAPRNVNGSHFASGWRRLGCGERNWDPTVSEFVGCISLEGQG
jgi:hypothetical protein